MTTYSFQDVTATLVGPTGTVNLGYGAAVSDEGISTEMSGDKNTMTIGADGEGMHSLHADNSGSVVVRLLKTSPVNAQLMAMYDAQRLSGNLWGNNQITIRQIQSGDVTQATQCAFKKRTGIAYKKVGDYYEWAFDAIRIDSVLGTY